MRYQDDCDPENVVVIYHGPCNDGFTAAWAAWMKFGDQARYYQTNYGRPPPTGLKGKDVFILDFSYPRDVIREIQKQAKSVLILDHHVTAEQELKHLDCAVFDMKRSGCGLAWDYFHGEPRPNIIVHAEDQDLWNFDYSYTRELMAVFETTEKTFENWNDLFLAMEDDIRYRELVAKGKAMLEYRNYLVRERFSKKPSYIYLDYNIIPAANSSIWQSEIGAALAKNKDTFAAVWSQMPDGRFKVSLRSDKRTGMDVSEVAKKYGGGGHKNAASFVTEHPPHIVNWEDVDMEMR